MVIHQINIYVGICFLMFQITCLNSFHDEKLNSCSSEVLVSNYLGYVKRSASNIQARQFMLIV